MKVLTARSKLISVRLSEEEYKHLQAVCGAQHARSVSDFIRSSILEMGEKRYCEDRYVELMEGIDATLRQQTQRMVIMDRKLARLMLLFIQSGERGDLDGITNDVVGR